VGEQFRLAIERMREFYIRKLINAGIFNKYDHTLDSLTLSELESIMKKTIPPKK
jgi:hypothetical protein